MVVYTLEQLEEILRHHFENHGNISECMYENCLRIFGRRAPSALYVRYLVKKVKESVILIHKPKREKPKIVRTPKNIAAVVESVQEAPSIEHFGDIIETNFA